MNKIVMNKVFKSLNVSHHSCFVVFSRSSYIVKRVYLLRVSRYNFIFYTKYENCCHCDLEKENVGNDGDVLGREFGFARSQPCPALRAVVDELPEAGQEETAVDADTCKHLAPSPP